MLRYGLYYDEDVRVMEWVILRYQDQNMPEKLTYKITDFVRSISFDENDEFKKEYILKLGKAVRQDFKKMLLAAKAVYEYSQVDKSEKPMWIQDEDGYAKSYYDESKDLTQMHMEYFITKYRVIHEYLTNIISKIIKFDKIKYKELNPEKVNKKGKLLLSNQDINSIKREYFENMFLNNDSIIKERFDAVRRIRNDVIHNGASCLLLDDQELLFQIYDLDVDEIASVDDYISNGNAISCNYFIATNISYLVYYLDCIFSSLVDINSLNNKSDTFCSIVYQVNKKEEANQTTEFLQKFMNMNFDEISDAQKCFMKIVGLYVSK